MRVTLVAEGSALRVSRPADHLFSLLITGCVLRLFDIRGQAHDVIILSVDGIVLEFFSGLDLIIWSSTISSLALNILRSTIIFVEQSVGPRVVVEDLVSSFVRSVILVVVGGIWVVLLPISPSAIFFRLAIIVDFIVYSVAPMVHSCAPTMVPFIWLANSLDLVVVDCTESIKIGFFS